MNNDVNATWPKLPVALKNLRVQTILSPVVQS